MKKTTFSIVAMALAAASVVRAECADTALPRVNVGRTPTYVSDNRVYLAARPKRKDLRIFAVLRVETVIDLTGSVDPEAVRAAGMRYLNIHLDEAFTLRSEALGTVVEAIGGASREHRVLVCDDDGELTAALWTLFSSTRQEVTQ